MWASKDFGGPSPCPNKLFGLDSDGTRLDFLGLGQGNGQNTVFKVSFGLVCHHLGQEAEDALEGAKALRAQVVSFLFLLFLFLKLALKREQVSGD